MAPVTYILRSSSGSTAAEEGRTVSLCSACKTCMGALSSPRQKSTRVPKTGAVIAAPVTPAARVLRFNIDDAPTGAAWELLSEATRSASTLFELVSIWLSLAN